MTQLQPSFPRSIYLSLATDITLFLSLSLSIALHHSRLIGRAFLSVSHTPDCCCCVSQPSTDPSSLSTPPAPQCKETANLVLLYVYIKHFTRIYSPFSFVFLGSCVNFVFRPFQFNGAIFTAVVSIYGHQRALKIHLCVFYVCSDRTGV